MKALYLLFILPFFINFNSFGQYEVLAAKKVRKVNGDKVRKGDSLIKADSIEIADKGQLKLDVESAMHLRLPPGKYHVGKESKRLNDWYDAHLELTKELKRKGLISCKFTYKTLSVPGTNRHYEIDRIQVDQKGIIQINSDTTSITLKWVNPDSRYNGGYHLILRDFYNHGFIDVIEVDEKKVTFYPGKYGHRHMYYTILADNCRASLRYKIQVNSSGTYSYGETNFLKPEN